jgi:hypothetical protein
MAVFDDEFSPPIDTVDGAIDHRRTTTSEFIDEGVEAGDVDVGVVAYSSPGPNLAGNFWTVVEEELHITAPQYDEHGWSAEEATVLKPENVAVVARSRDYIGDGELWGDREEARTGSNRLECHLPSLLLGFVHLTLSISGGA